MWSEESFAADLAKIASKGYSELLVLQQRPPEDAFLRYRFQFTEMLQCYHLNDFVRSREIAGARLNDVLEFISGFDVTFLTEEKPSPPFDFMLLVMMNAVSDHPTFSLLLKLREHYVFVKSLITKLPDSDAVFLNDRIKRQEIRTDKRSALVTVQSRIDYCAELVASLLYTARQYQVLISFLNDYCSPTFTDSEETLSHLGRISLAIGDSLRAVKYFERIKNEELKSANQGYLCYFTGEFKRAYDEFVKGKSKSPANFNVCLKYLGQGLGEFIEMSSPKKLSLEESTQWPAQPKGQG
jgi:tetratricopeptide (TPR) repeat protein